MKSMKLPPLGLRIIKSSIGVLLCYVVYVLRGRTGIVFYSQLAVLWCIQPYISGTLNKAIQRTTGTLIGAGFGLITILIYKYILVANNMPDYYYFALVSFFIIPILYTTVVIKKKDASYFSTVVYLSIVVIHIGDVNPFLFTFNRVLDTMIGIFLGLVVNTFRLPRKQRKDILFVSGVDDTLLNENEVMSPFSKIELNRMLDEGANFTISTIRTPASIIDALGEIKFKLPIITMDGAALYDLKERKYLHTCQLNKQQAKNIIKLIESHNTCCFTNIVIDGLLLISHNGLKTGNELKMYNDLRYSPHRHFVKADLLDQGQVLYLMAFGEEDKMKEIYDELMSCDYVEGLKVLFYPSTTYPGNYYLKVYDKEATRENMIEILKKETGLTKTMTFGSIEGKYDVLVKNNPNLVVKTLEKVYEPYIWQK